MLEYPAKVSHFDQHFDNKIPFDRISLSMKKIEETIFDLF